MRARRRATRRQFLREALARTALSTLNPIPSSRRRLGGAQGTYYCSVAMLLADLCRMCENCRFYNGEGTTYWDCAMRLENYAKNKLNAIAVRKVAPPAAAAAAAAAGAKPA